MPDRSRLNLGTPSRGSGYSVQPQTLVPVLRSTIAAQGFPPLVQGRLTIELHPPMIHDHPWIVNPCLLVAVKPADPEVDLVDEPVLSRRCCTSAYVLS